MKVTIRDRVALQFISIADIVSYLRSIGASKRSDYRNVASIWQLGEAELLIPNSKELADYAARVADIVTRLEQHEQRSQLQIINDIALSGYDIVRVRSASDDMEPGSLPLDSGVELAASARDMMLSAACAASTHRFSYPSKKPKEAEDYIKKVRMGQTERGSFILTLLSPVPPALVPRQGTLLPGFSGVDPFERTVVTTLGSGLNAVGVSARKAIETGSSDPFWQEPESGISTNLCEAIIRMHEVSRTESIDVRITWSRNRPSLENSAGAVRISNEHIPAISEAVRVYKLNQPEPDQLVSGVVVKCHRESNSTTGQITILDFASGTTRRIIVELSGESYSRAVEAHRLGQQIQTFGEVLRAGRSYKLGNHSPLRYSDAGDLDG